MIAAPARRARASPSTRPRALSRPMRRSFHSISLVNAIVAGMLLGGFYAAVTVGVTISFGMLDIANIAQPAFIMLGSFVAYIDQLEFRARPDPDRRRDDAAVLSARDGGLPALLLCLRAARRAVDPGARLLLRPVVCRRGVADPDLRRRLPLRRGAAISARACISAMSTCRCACWSRSSSRLLMVGAAAALSRRAALSAGRSSRCRRTGWRLQLMAANPIRIKQIAFGISIATCLGRRRAS